MSGELLVMNNKVLITGEVRLAWVGNGDEFDFAISEDNARALIGDLESVLGSEKAYISDVSSRLQNPDDTSGLHDQNISEQTE